MGAFFIMERYSKINEKRKREIVLLRGRGCVYKKCAFCDYHADKCSDENENFALNRSVLRRVTGEFGELEVINSGSVFELDKQTLAYIKQVCREKSIKIIHFESHWLYADRIPALRREFAEFTLKIKLGLETFDFHFREKILKKGIPEKDASIISRHFDEANLLFGLKGQTAKSMKNDIEVGLAHFERLCVNIMCRNTTAIQPDENVINIFMQDIYPRCKNDDRVDILISNTDFGVGD